jgi:hypothetical protein
MAHSVRVLHIPRWSAFAVPFWTLTVTGWAGWFRLLPSAVSAAVRRDSAEMQHWQAAVPTQHTDVVTPRMQDAPVQRARSAQRTRACQSVLSGSSHFLDEPYAAVTPAQQQVSVASYIARGLYYMYVTHEHGVHTNGERDTVRRSIGASPARL